MVALPQEHLVAANVKHILYTCINRSTTNDIHVSCFSFSFATLQ